jgi:hypothetical protein
MTNRRPWTDAENAALVTLYFRMLDAAIAGKPYNKAAMIRIASNVTLDPNAPLVNRSRASIEFKLCNATACHASLAPGAVTMNEHGYRALGSYQKSLKSAMRAAVYRREVGAHNVGTCKHCSEPYRYNNMGHHDKGYCSAKCYAAGGDY